MPKIVCQQLKIGKNALKGGFFFGVLFLGFGCFFFLYMFEDLFVFSCRVYLLGTCQSSSVLLLGFANFYLGQPPKDPRTNLSLDNWNFSPDGKNLFPFCML